MVHLDYGVGKYLGVELMPFQKTVREVLTLEYEAGDRIYVPVEKMNRVHLYESQLEVPPKLTRLRTTEWDQIRIKTRKAVDNYAKELIELYANRFVVEGFRFSPDSDFQKRMEASFVYDETTDQLQAVEDIKKDIRSSGEREIPSRLIGEVVMQNLRKIDEVAFIRFASVYRRFEDINEFSEEVEKLTSD